MHPILFKLGPFTLHTYGALLALGAALGLGLTSRLARRNHLDGDRVMSLALWVLVAGLAGSRLAYVWMDWPAFVAEPWRVIFLWDGGLVFYGGLLGGVIAGPLLARGYGLPLLPMLDAFAPGLVLAQLFGRLGCFAAGCCYGAPWPGGACAVVFGDPQSLAPRGVPLHPAQLYAVVKLAAILGILAWLWPRRRFAGQVFFSYGVLHGLGRLLVEQFRGDFRGIPLTDWLTPTGAFALALALLSALGLWWSWRKGESPCPPAPAPPQPAAPAAPPRPRGGHPRTPRR